MKARYELIRNIGLVVGLLVWSAKLLAQPAMTEIRDTIYSANGRPFEGTVTISWKTFFSAENTYVVTSSTTVPIVNGVLQVRLAPTTDAQPPSYYEVVYTSNGRVQFREYWAVPPSATPLRLRDVRLAAPPVVSSTSSGGTIGFLNTQITISDVVGLEQELANRPVKGPAYAPSRVAVINPEGAIDAVAGDPTECVTAGGTTVPCGGSLEFTFVDGEQPSGQINGTNRTFTLANEPSPASSLKLYRNGLLLKEGLDYTISGNTITFLSGAEPQPGDVLVASYRTNLLIAEAFPSTGGAAAATASLSSLPLSLETKSEQTLLLLSRIGLEVAAFNSHKEGVLLASLVR